MRRVSSRVHSWIPDLPTWVSIGAPPIASVFTCVRRQAGVDHGEPATLAIADEIHPAAERLHGLLQHDDVLLDGEVDGFVGSRQPIDGVKAIQSGVAQCDHLALVLAVVDDRRRMTGLRRKHQGWHARRGRRCRVVQQPRDRPGPHFRGSFAHVGFSRRVVTRANSAMSSAMPSGDLFRLTALAAYSVALAAADTHASRGAHANSAAILMGRSRARDVLPWWMQKNTGIPATI